MEIKLLACRTRSGNKVHRSCLGSTVTDCGVWLKTQSSVFAVKGKVHRKYLCEKCFGTKPTTECLAELGLELAD